MTGEMFVFNNNNNNNNNNIRMKGENVHLPVGIKRNPLTL
jgi:hypothetical protein